MPKHKLWSSDHCYFLVGFFVFFACVCVKFVNSWACFTASCKRSYSDNLLTFKYIYSLLRTKQDSISLSELSELNPLLSFTGGLTIFWINPSSGVCVTVSVYMDV